MDNLLVISQLRTQAKLSAFKVLRLDSFNSDRVKKKRCRGLAFRAKTPTMHLRF